jgi:hypothetical protein
MTKGNTSAIALNDLPVRKVSIFGARLVVPKDAFCEVMPSVNLRVEYYELGVQATFTVQLHVSLAHIHFAGKTKQFTALLYEEECTDKEAFRPRMKRRIDEEWDGGTEKYIKSARYELSAPARRAIMKTVDSEGLVDAALNMFLAGDMRKAPLVPYLPRKPVFT